MKKYVSLHSLKNPPCLKSKTSILTPNESFVDHLSSNFSFSTTNKSVEESDASFPLGSSHDNVHLSTGGMGPVTSTVNQFCPFSDIKQEVHNHMQAYPQYILIHELRHCCILRRRIIPVFHPRLLLFMEEVLIHKYWLICLLIRFDLKRSCHHRF